MNLKAQAALLAGMGEEGRFTRDDLRYLMLNVTYAVSALEVESFATVLIGSGKGNLELSRAVRSMVLGICEALNRLPGAPSLKRVQIVEHNEDRFREIYRTIEQTINADATPYLKIELTKSAERNAKARARAKNSTVDTDGRDDGKSEVRITIERDGDKFRFSALTRTAVMPVREVEIGSFFSEGIADRLMSAAGREDQETFGRLLTTSLIPADFQALLDSAGQMTFVLDRATAAFPWEMACFGAPNGVASLGADMHLARQFRTLLSPAPGIAPPVNENLRVLVIADPASEPELQLPGARREGREMVKLLGQIKQEGNLDIEVIDRIGETECDAVEILGLVLEGNFDVIHYAGHGVFDVENPSHSGWVFGRGRILSAREIFRARRVPRLVFANACFSAVVNKGRAFTAEEMNRHLAGLAEAFFERGVENYIGAGWPVQDDLAISFAKMFYARALAGKEFRYFERRQTNDRRAKTKRNGAADTSEKHFTRQSLGDALAEARRTILHQGSTWGAYHHYGQADDYLMNIKTNPSPPIVPRRKPAAKRNARAAGKAESKPMTSRK
jgi:hypothetical protein